MSGTGLDGGALIERARGVARLARAAAAESESARRLPPELVEAMVGAGLFRLCVPRALGGLEAGVAPLLAAIEEVARGDGAAGWCVMIGATSGLLAGYLEEPVARALFGDPRAIAGGVVAPRGAARAADGGFRVSGRWPFASGSSHAGWIGLGCLIFDGDRPRVRPPGVPDARVALVEARALTVHDTWQVTGLRASASHDVEARELAVPAERMVSLLDPPRAAGPLYAFPLMSLLALGVAAVALGIARAALEALVELAGSKPAAGAKKSQRDRPLVQIELALAEGDLRAGRALLFDAAGEAWREAERGAVSEERQALLRLAAVHAAAASARAVDRAWSAGGATSIYQRCAIERCFRDVHVATQHAMVAPQNLQTVGRVLLGLPVEPGSL